MEQRLRSSLAREAKLSLRVFPKLTCQSINIFWWLRFGQAAAPKHRSATLVAVFSKRWPTLSCPCSAKWIHPRRTWCYSRETYMHTCKVLMISCLKGRGLYQSMVRFIERYNVAMSMEMDDAWRLRWKMMQILYFHFVSHSVNLMHSLFPCFFPLIVDLYIGPAHGAVTLPESKSDRVRSSFSFLLSLRCLLFLTFSLLMHVLLKEFGVRLRAAAIWHQCMTPTDPSAFTQCSFLLLLQRLWVTTTCLTCQNWLQSISLSSWCICIRVLLQHPFPKPDERMLPRRLLSWSSHSSSCEALGHKPKRWEPAGIGFATLSVKLMAILSHQRSQLTFVAEKEKTTCSCHLVHVVSANLYPLSCKFPCHLRIQCYYIQFFHF